jgi:uncharacterized lipoprotein NlpE involved in copper resistance
MLMGVEAKAISAVQNAAYLEARGRQESLRNQATRSSGCDVRRRTTNQGSYRHGQCNDGQLAAMDSRTSVDGESTSRLGPEDQTLEFRMLLDVPAARTMAVVDDHNHSDCA